ncbi:hypothetical protein U0070_014693, partial [Myodes glareolus]
GIDLILRDRHLVVVEDEGGVDAGELRDGGHVADCRHGHLMGPSDLTSLEERNISEAVRAPESFNAETSNCLSKESESEYICHRDRLKSVLKNLTLQVPKGLTVHNSLVRSVVPLITLLCSALILSHKKLVDLTRRHLTSQRGNGGQDSRPEGQRKTCIAKGLRTQTFKLETLAKGHGYNGKRGSFSPKLLLSSDIQWTLQWSRLSSQDRPADDGTHDDDISHI